MIPANNPFLITQAICLNCGSILNPEVSRSAKGKVNEVSYSCTNEASGCAWTTVVSLSYISGDGPRKFTTDKANNLSHEDQVKMRREETAQLAEFSKVKENAIRELIAILPALKELVAVMKAAESSVAELPSRNPQKASTETVTAESQAEEVQAGE